MPLPLPQVPRVYANGVGLGYSKTESLLTFMFANEPLVTVILPFPVAKEVKNQLEHLIADYEKKMGHEVPLLAAIAPREEAKPAS